MMNDGTTMIHLIKRRILDDLGPTRVATAVFLVGLVAVVFYRVLGFGYLNIDDPTLILGNERVQAVSLDNVIAILDPSLTASRPSPEYKPVPELLWMISGAARSPFWAHLLNLICHAICCVEVFLLLALFFRNRWPACVGAIVFAAHPLQVESVVWASSLSRLLCCSFIFGSLFLAMHSLQKNGERSSYLASLLLCLLALLSKVYGVTLAPLILIYVFTFRSPEPFFRKLRFASPFIVLTMVYVAHFLYLQLSSSHFSTIEKTFAFNSGLACSAFWLYARYFFVVHDLVPYHYLESDLANFENWMWSGYLFVVFYALIVAAFYKKRVRTGLFFALWFFIVLVPVLNLVPKANWFANRYAYLSNVSLCCLTGFGVFYVSQRVSRVLGALIFLIPGMFFMVVTLQEIEVYRDSRFFWTEVLSRYPKASQAWTGLGAILCQRGNCDTCGLAYETAISVGAEKVRLYSDLGTCYLRQNNLEKAQGLLDLALSKDPDIQNLRYHRALIAKAKGDYAAAEPLLRGEITRNRALLEPYMSLADICIHQGRLDEAEELLKMAKNFHPTDPGLLNALGGLYYLRKDTNLSRAYFRRALQMEPGFEPAKRNLQKLFRENR